MYEISKFTLFHYFTRMYYVNVHSLTLILQDAESSG